MIAPDLLETTVAAAAGATRRLTTKEKVKAEIGESGTTYDALIDQYIDQISDAAARSAGLAADSAGAFPTFGAETLRATWYAGLDDCFRTVLLPWRVKWAVTGITENGSALVSGTDYRLLPGGEVRRINGGRFGEWFPDRDLVVTFTAGWTLPAGVPASLEARVIEQVRYQMFGRDRDPGLRSLDVPGVASESFNVPGGSSISEHGLLLPLERALDDYRRETIG